MSKKDSLEKCNTGDRNTCNQNAGHWNTGNQNAGHWNTGNRNTGHWNTGNQNAGKWNAGNQNAGKWNTGNWNTGDWNAGHRNTGDWNAGKWNTGDWNAGKWNAGDWNTGIFNTNSPFMRAFNKDTNIIIGSAEYDLIQWPDFLFFKLTEWVKLDDMAEEERKEHPECSNTKGYLKVYNYKEAFRNSWNKVDDEDHRKVLKLPNFDNEIFKEISGIDVDKELSINSGGNNFCPSCGKKLKGESNV